MGGGTNQWMRAFKGVGGRARSFTLPHPLFTKQNQPTQTQTGLALDPKGFLAVAPTFQSLSHPGVFAAGDIASVLEYPRPKVRGCGWDET